MYSQKIIASHLEEFASREHWIPVYHTYDEVLEFSEYIKSLTKIEGNSKNSYVTVTKALTSTRVAEIKRWIENEQCLCAIDANYWETRYAWVCNEQGDIYKYQPRLSQRILDALIAGFDEQQVSIELLILKGRQLGVTSWTALKFIRRLLFVPHTQAIMASVKAAASELIGRILDTAYNRCPWWLVPRKMPKHAFDNGSILSIQSGMQATGLAQGWTPVAIHISELADVPNAKKVIEEGLFRATHSSKNLFMVLEGTGGGSTGWLADTWRAAKEDWPKGRSRLCPVFVSWPLCPEIYPQSDWIRKFPVPLGFMSNRVDATRKHVAKAESYIRNTPYLAKVAGNDYKMPVEQQWYWEFNYLSACKNHTQKTWLSQMPCVTGDTLISTEKGIIRIDQAKDAKRCESGEILDWIPRGPKHVYEIKTAYGRSIKATREHLFQTTRGWQPVGNCIAGTEIHLIPPMFAADNYIHHWNDTPLYQCVREIDEDMGRFLGYFMGDGCFHQQELDIACDAQDTDTIDDVNRLIVKLTGKAPWNQRVGKMVRVRSPNQFWIPFLRSLGAIQPVIHSTLKRPDGWRRKVCVPECIWTSPKEVVRNFLSALYECDGHAVKKIPRVTLSSSHEEFLRQVQHLLLGFGLNAQISSERKICGGSIKGGKRHEYTQRLLSLPSAFANQFYDEIRFAGQRKQTSGKRRVSEKYAAVRLVDEVVSICWHSVSEVYDISVSETHMFSANGLCAHNCDDFEALVGEHDTVFDPEIMAEVEQEIYEVQGTQKERKQPIQAYAITGHDVDESFYPDDTTINWDKPVIQINWRNYRGQSYRWEMIPLLPLSEDQEINTMDRVLIYEEPQKGNQYTFGIDTADGLGKEDEDRTVLSGTKNRFHGECDEQVCELTSNRLNAAQAVAFAACLGAYYGPSCSDPRGVMFATEQVGRPGETCQHQLKMMGFNHHYRPKRFDSKKIRDEFKSKEGWWSTSWTVGILMTRFVEAVNGGWYRPRSRWLIEELKTLERHVTSGKSKMEHRSGQHDDRVRAAAQSYFCAHDMDVLTERAQRRYNLPQKSNILPKGECKANMFSIGNWE